MLIVIFFFLSFLTATLSLINCYFYFKKKQSIKERMKKLQLHLNSQGENKLTVMANYFNETKLGKKLYHALNRSNVAINPWQFLLISMVINFIIFYLLDLLLNIGWILELSFSLLIVKFGIGKFLIIRENQVVENVNKQLPEVGRLLSSAIRAGLNIQQGIELVAHEIKDPMGLIFRRLASELALGTSLEKAVGFMQENVNSNELKLMANTLVIQHKAGGNLVRIMEEMAHTLEMRQRVNQEIKVNTSEARFIANILPIMPIAAAVILNIIIPGFIKPLFTLPGIILLVVFLGILGIGYALIHKITDIKV